MYRIIFLTLAICCQFSLKSQVNSENKLNKSTSMTLMPLPTSIKLNNEKFRLNRKFNVSIDKTGFERLESNTSRFIYRLDQQTCLFLNTAIAFEKPANTQNTLTISVNRAGNLKVGEDEGYYLQVTPNTMLIKAETDLGAMHALETLLQLVDSDSLGFFIPGIEITDSPRFTWRGLMIDVARHFMPVDVIKRNIDGMALVKMNVLHLHLSDDQGFRVESKTYPKLHEMGSDGQYFTQIQVKEIIEYANLRGIRVVPEFDMPAHTTAWFVGYPFLASAPGPYQIEREIGIFDPAINPADDRTYGFLDTLLTEMCQLFNDEYFHIGGDECNGNQWNANPSIQNFMKKNNIKDNHDLQAGFNLKLNQILKKNNKKMMGWEEIKNPQLPSDIMIHAWKGEETLVQAVKEGYNVILSRGYYIDLMFQAGTHYAVDPVPASGLTDEEKKRVLGGEATMWSEYVTTENIDSRIWPRTAAIAERLWSEASVTNIDDMYLRLENISLRMEWVGLTHNTYYPMMLRRLALGNDIEPLQTLADVCETLEEYNRWPDFNQSTGLTIRVNWPFTRLMDAAKPESDVARKFNKLVLEYLATPTPELKSKIEAQLELWKNNHNKLAELIKCSPALVEIEPLSAKLSQLAELGLVSLNADNNITKDKKWQKEGSQLLKSAQKPNAQLTLKITGGIENLFKNAIK